VAENLVRQANPDDRQVVLFAIDYPVRSVHSSFWFAAAVCSTNPPTWIAKIDDDIPLHHRDRFICILYPI
jgi:hypothetical protein